MRRQTLPPEALDDTDRAILNNLQRGVSADPPAPSTTPARRSA